jgi:surface antigen
MRPVRRIRNRDGAPAVWLGTALAAVLALSLSAPTPPAFAHGKHRPSHRHHRVVKGVGHGRGSATSCAGGVCFAEDPFYLYAGQCTWYAAGRRPDLNGIVHGNAGDWLNEARGRVPEGKAPVVGAIAVWLPNTGGSFGAGHVAYVAAVSGDSVTVEDFNWGRPARSYHRHTVSASAISGYIYGGPTRTSPAPAPVQPPAPTTTTPGTSGTPPGPTPSSGTATTPVAVPQPVAGGPVYFVHHVTGTCRDGACGLTIRSGPGYTGYAALGALPEGAEADVVCQAIGQTVSNGYAASSIWDRLTDGRWVSDFYLDTPSIGTWSPPIPQC